MLHKVGRIQLLENRLREFNIAMYPDPVRQHLELEGAIVISDANPEGRMNVEFCFDSDYRLDYVKSYPELKKIFGLE